MCNIAKRPPMNNNEVTCTIGLLTENGCSTLIASDSFQESVADIQYISRHIEKGMLLMM